MIRLPIRNDLSALDTIRLFLVFSLLAFVISACELRDKNYEKLVILS